MFMRRPTARLVANIERYGAYEPSQAQFDGPEPWAASAMISAATFCRRIPAGSKSVAIAFASTATRPITGWAHKVLRGSVETERRYVETRR